MNQETFEYQQPTVNIWFPDQEEPVYDPKDPISDYQFKEYWKREKDRMMNGFTIADGKVKISGWLYWHTVYWKIKKNEEIEGRMVPTVGTPNFRDIDWDAAINIEKALDDGKFIELVGARGFGKSVWQSSYVSRLYTLYPKSQSVISAGNGPDVKVVTDMCAMGMDELHPVLKKKRLRNDWNKEVLAGIKNADGTAKKNSSKSQIIMRNYRDGNNPMASNGTRPQFHVIDEIGKINNFSLCVSDSYGAWWAGNQQRADGSIKPSCLAMFTGTGGDMEVGKDAADMFYNPEANNLLAFDDVWEGRGKIAWFISALKAKMEYKEPATLASYLGIDHTDLEKITILVANEERALEKWWKIEYALVRKTGNQQKMLKFKAAAPLVPSDAFIVLSSNNFNVEGAKKQQDRIKASGGEPNYVELYHDGEKITHKFSEKLPVPFPVRSESKDTPVVIWEFPDKNPPFGLYVAGVDPYKQGKAAFSDSLGAVYIMKRMHDIQSDRYQDMFVASYVGRPDNKSDWEEQARLLIKYYNARTLVENDEYSFIEYMKYKGDEMYLERQPDWLKQIVPNSQVSREYGVHRSADKIRNHLHDSLKKYMDQVVFQEKDDKGSVVTEHLGVNKILDSWLLEEIIKWNDKDNYDRVVAAELAIALARHLDPIIGKAGNTETDPRFAYLFSKNKKKSGLFGRTSGLFTAKKDKLFS